MSNDGGTFRDLLRSKRFFPLLVTQFVGAFNDNLFKNAALLLILFGVADTQGFDGKVIVTAAVGLFILPYILFSSIAGHLSDRFDKAHVMRAVKAAEIPIMGLAAYGFATADGIVLLVALFLMGAQSAFFSPCKFGYLPDALRETQLLGANALVEATTFLAILTGTIAGGLLVMGGSGPGQAAMAVVMIAVGGFIASCYIPRAGARAPDTRIRPNLVGETIDILGHAKARRDIWLTILGISWFWFLGTALISQVPTFTKEVITGNEAVATLLLTALSVGIGAGSLLCQRLLKGEISIKYVPFAALAMAGFAWAFFLLSTSYVPGSEPLTIGAFFADGTSILLLASLAGLAVAGALYIVPLNALLQHRADERHRSRTMAANNIVSAFAIVLSSGIIALLLLLDLTVLDVFLGVALASVTAALIVCRLLPDELIKGLFAGAFRLAFRVEVRGLENARAAGKRAVFVANHPSFIDGMLLAVFLPHTPVFAVASTKANLWYMKPFLAPITYFAIDPTSPFATKAIIREVEKGQPLVIFPEGRLTRTGSLMKIYDGPGMVADKTGAPLVPVRIDGAQFSVFSRLKGKVPRRLFPKITVTVLPPRPCQAAQTLVGRDRRKAIAQQLYDVMSEMMFETDSRSETLFEALLEARRIHGGRTAILEDPERRPLSYDRLVLSALMLGHRLDRLTSGQDTVGMLLPSGSATAATFFALQAYGRTPALLNFTTGSSNVLSSCEAARIRTVVTSRRFVEMGGLESLTTVLGDKLRLVYLEDIRKGIGLTEKLTGLYRRRFARRLRRAAGAQPQDTAVVLFTSGSEGVPKGVALSHENILANCRQIGARIDFTASDSVFNALPLFHSFGLTGGFLLPVLSGVRTFLYPSPLHCRVIPELVYHTNSTVLFGTDTFLSGYAAKASAYDFYSLRYVFAGAERLQPETRRLWSEKFGLRILEGYGATECAPVISLNTPMHFKAGTVGRLLPGIEHRLEPVPGIAKGGRLVIRGPNIMRGYLRHDNPGALEAPPDGWYDTGDIVEIDEDGFVTIVGRAKRFAKIAGEMVSLSVVESLAHELWPENQHAAVSLSDSRKGEQLALLSDRTAITREELLTRARARGLSELMVPRVLLTVDQVPVLGTGKTDYHAVQRLAEDLTPARPTA